MLLVICPFKLLFTFSQPWLLHPKSQLLSLRLTAAGKIEAAGNVRQQCVLWFLVVDDLCGSSLDPKEEEDIFLAVILNKVLVVETLTAPQQQ